MRFLVDENLGKRFADLLNRSGYDAVFVGDAMRGFPDEEILTIANTEKRVLITDDKDFGELVFRFNKITSGVVLFRTLTNNSEEKLGLVKNILRYAEGSFIVVSEGGIRVRKI